MVLPKEVAFTPTITIINSSESHVTRPDATTPILPAVSYLESCATIDTIVPDGFLSTGRIILDDVEKLYFISSEDMDIRLFSNNSGFIPIVTPDGEKLAQSIVKKDEYGDSYYIEVLSPKGEQISLLMHKQNWVSPYYWLDNIHLVILDNDETMTVVDVLSGEETMMDYSDPALLRDSDSYPAYETSLTRMVYVRREYEFGVANLVLDDMVTGNELWTSHDLVEEFRWLQPSWSPDGSQFAVGIPWSLDYPNYQLYVVGRDGQEKHVTNILNHDLEKAGLWPEIFGTSWSPDSRYVAFWYGGNLMVFDTKTEIVKDYCLRSIDAVGTQAYWSPDSRQLAFNIDNEPDKEPARIVVLDISSGRAVEVADNSLIIG